MMSTLVQKNNLVQLPIQTSKRFIDNFEVRASICCNDLPRLKNVLENNEGFISYELLLFSSTHGHIEIFKYLVGELYGKKTQKCDGRAFWWAARYGNLSILKYLLEECGVEPTSFHDISVEYGTFDYNDYTWNHFVHNLMDRTFEPTLWYDTPNIGKLYTKRFEIIKNRKSHPPSPRCQMVDLVLDSHPTVTEYLLSLPSVRDKINLNDPNAGYLKGIWEGTAETREILI
jgi:hypothetical protein